MIDTTFKPASYIVCLATETECPKAATCLRSLVYRQEGHTTANRQWITVVNPNAKDMHYATEQCAAYNDSALMKYAVGMKHIFDNVPQAIYKEVHKDVKNCFSCRTYFFYSKKGDRHITAKEQTKIRQVFMKYNLGEPAFDRFIELPSYSLSAE